MCPVCKAPTVGVPAFYIDTLVQDLKDKSVEYHMIGYDGVAKSIFGPKVTPTEVKDMDKVLVNDKLESWFESAIYVSMCLVWVEEKGKVRVSPHNLVPLPLEYMPGVRELMMAHGDACDEPSTNVCMLCDVRHSRMYVVF